MVKQKGSIIFPFISGIAVVAIVIAGYLLWSTIDLKNKPNPKELAPTDQVTPTPIKTEETTTEPVPEPKNDDTNPQVVTNKKVLPYELPSGWSTVVSRDGRFEIGFDPKKNKLYDEEASRSGISFFGIWSTEGGQTRNLGYRYSFRIASYDNGSRHNFLYRQLSFKPYGTGFDDYPSNNYEKEYVVQGWPCLVLNGIDVSQWSQIWGVCPISKTEAIFFTMDGDEQLVEQVLQTVRLLK